METIYHSGKLQVEELLPIIIKDYKNTEHRTTRMKPVEVNKQNEKRLFKEVYNKPYKSVKLKFKFGDKVRISKSKVFFFKGLHTKLVYKGI